MIENPTTPRKRIREYLRVRKVLSGPSVIDSYGVGGSKRPLLSEDLHAVLNANAGHERIIAEQRSEAVEDYKKTLSAELRHRVATTPSPDHFWVMGLEEIADDLEDGTL